jgi:hypothetical protein
MQQGLTLARPAFDIARPAVFLYLRRMAGDRAPSFDLPLVLAAFAARRGAGTKAAPHVITAVPLEPSARIVRLVDPSFCAPYAERLACVPPEIIERVVVPGGGELCVREPALGKFAAAVRHVFAAKHAEREHFFWRELRFEIGREVAARGLGERIAIAALHRVVHGDGHGIIVTCAGTKQKGPGDGFND